MTRLHRAGVLRLLSVLVAAGIAGGPALAAAAAPAGAEILQELRAFASTGTVLYVAAHPDDENTELITWFSRGRHYRTGYLSLTRGDGGQNELGKDFGDRLGVLRTQELLAARALDGGRQFFTRAIDFGFSKNPEETLRFWGHDAVLGDVVRVIRQFRPDVLVTRFPIPPGSGGHGHHTASAMLAVEAFKLAGDPKAYPEQVAAGLAPWQPKRVLWNVFRWGNPPPPLPLSGPTFDLDIAGTDDATGESFGAIAARSRSMHKTQGLGGFTSRTGNGPNVQTFLLLAGEPAAHDFLDGVDTTWNRVPGGAEIGGLVDAALAAFKPDDPAASVPALLAIRLRLAALPPDPLVDDKRRDLDRLVQACAGLVAETTVDHADVVPGESFPLHHSAVVHSAVPVKWIGVRYAGAPPVTPGDARALTPNEPARRDTDATLSIEAPLTQPYWLREEPSTGLYTVDEPGLIGRPVNPPAFPVEQVFEIGGQQLVVATDPVQPVASASPAGSRRPLEVVAPVALSWLHPLELLAPGATRTVTLELRPSRSAVKGRLELEVPAGWRITPTARDFVLGPAGEPAQVSFEVTAPAAPAEVRLSVHATIGRRHYHRARVELHYDHLPVQLLQPDAMLHVTAFPVANRARRVGYLPGAGDSVDENLRLLGAEVVPLTGADLNAAKLAGLDAVVIGVRAFNERTDLAANLPALWAWVEAGGVVVAQYNRPNGLRTPELGPYKLSLEGNPSALRITDENSPVTFLAPDHPALNTPNKIGPADFTGWVQERGAYFPSSWDEAHYTPILALNDPGESPLRDGVLIARLGRGYYVYTGLAFFRQLPAGVPGAYRLFANLVSLGK